ncbi:LLM class flavin-dependent oxidoreductase [Mycobacteroides abscessus subsp. bolletii]|uniref:LLM class flavin-dependent oxidoreductase n=1 Tax=Mycobacteroides abscessus TaxID=36809 RepID=UPI0019D08F9A|nr:LLM class flavin-dependent oxidoreductase [Mycobacteroides abscessus]MBN7300492.1 LLM class flavin-dependent oxidoreductase [Mycobacteroides abscessus subsp. bolletii]
MTTVSAVIRPDVPPEQLCTLARVAEDAGLDQLWLWEDCFWGGAMALASAALAVTERLRIGVALHPVPLRNVALAAMEIAALHRLFPDRVHTAVGHGVQEWMGQVGARVESPMSLLREHLVALRALLSGERVTTHGRYVRLDDVALGWPPSSPPSVFSGGLGPRTLALSGELADGTILTTGTTFEMFPEAQKAVDAGRYRGGRTDPHRFIVGVNAESTGGSMPVAEEVRRWFEAGVDTVMLTPNSGSPDAAAFVRFAADVGRQLA